MGLKVLYYYAWKDDGLYLNSELLYIRIINETKAHRMLVGNTYISCGVNNSMVKMYFIINIAI